MKILCDTEVINRVTQSLMTRTKKATLGVGLNTFGKARDASGTFVKELEIIHFTPKKKTGVRYKVKDNILHVYTTFIRDGKASISFKEPPERINIKCDPLQLMSFMRMLQLGIAGKPLVNVKLNVATATAIPRKLQPKCKMTVTKVQDYPSGGFPLALKMLVVSGIELHKVPSDVCSLKNLTKLDLSDNKLSTLPTELGELSLVELDVNTNALCNAKSWMWLSGKPLQKSLQILDLSANNITYFPRLLVKFENIVTLKLNNNSISHIPFGMRRMRNLRIFHIAKNKLTSLPSIFNNACFEIIDVWGNHFKSRIEHDLHSIAAANARTPCTSRIMPLWLLSARAVLQNKLPYSSATVPSLLVDFMSEAPTCACGKLCYDLNSMLRRASSITFKNVKTLIFSREYNIYSDMVLCGPKCTGRKLLHT